MQNIWVGTGRITKELELKEVGTGTSLLNFAIAVERNFKNAQGERETDFINIVAWRATADNIAKYFKKGDGIGIVGSLQTRSYENKEGRTIYITEIVADSFDFPIQNKERYGDSSQGQTNTQGNNQNTQTAQNKALDDPFESTGAEISDSDLPF